MLIALTKAQEEPSDLKPMPVGSNVNGVLFGGLTMWLVCGGSGTENNHIHRLRGTTGSGGTEAPHIATTSPGDHSDVPARSEKHRYFPNP